MTGVGGNTSWYALLNEPDVRDTVVNAAAERFGFPPEQVEMRLYVGRFAGGTNEARVRKWAAEQAIGAGPLTVIGTDEVVAVVRKVAARKQYRDNPVLATMKVLAATGALVPAE